MNNEINAIIIDDEPRCIDNLQHYLLENCPRIKIIGTGDQPECAERLSNKLPVDVAFLDIHLFDRNIFEWLPLTKKDIPIVLVTAYEQYALPAFRVSALDYLLKPLETSAVQRCYNKIIKHLDDQSKVQGGDKGKRITLKQGDHVYIVSLQDVIMLKANGFYTVVYFDYDGKMKEVVLSKPISNLCQEWDEPQLMRMHRSFAVNLRKITSVRKSISGVSLETPAGLVPVAKKRIPEFFERYNA